MSDNASNEAIGAVLGGMIAFDQALSNRLMASGWEAAEEWAIRYALLVEAIEKVNNDLKTDRVLAHFHSAWQAKSDAGHYREMKEKFSE